MSRHRCPYLRFRKALAQCFDLDDLEDCDFEIVFVPTTRTFRTFRTPDV